MAAHNTMSPLGKHSPDAPRQAPSVSAWCFGGVAGAAVLLILYFGNITPLAIGLASLFLVVALVAGIWSHRCIAKQRAAEHHAMEQDCRAHIEEIREKSGITGLDELCTHVLPVWGGQIEMSRSHMENETISLAERFADISRRLTDAVSRVDSNGKGGSGESLINLLQSAQSDLDSIVSGLKQALDSKVSAAHRDVEMSQKSIKLKSPRHPCGNPMISRGVRGLGDVRRWWCPVCNEWDAMRGPAHYLRGGPEHGLERVAALACRGLSVHAIQKRTGMSWGAVQLRMQRLADEAKNRYRVRAPGVGSGWWCVALPETFPKAGVAAVGKQRQSYRLLGWATGAEAGLIIEQQMGRDIWQSGGVRGHGSSLAAEHDTYVGMDQVANYGPL